MKASHLEEIYDLETAVENAAEAHFRANALQVVRPRTPSRVKAPYVTIAFGVATETGRLTAFKVQGIHRPCQWEGVLTVGIVTNRTAENTPPASAEAPVLTHQRLRAKVRMIMADWQLGLAGQPYHAFAWCRETGTINSIEATEDHDVSTVSFAMQVRAIDEAFANFVTT